MSLVESLLTNKKAQEGEVKFSKSSPQDPFCIKMAGLIANARQVPVEQIMAEIEKQVEKVKAIAQKAPTIHSTIVDNIYESELFSMFEDLTIPVPGAPKFDKVIFSDLRRFIRGEHNRFWPLRNFIEKRPHTNPAHYFTDDPDDPDTKQSRWMGVNTAAATPNGEFIFNIPFMQKLIDWAHLKQIKPKGRKYDNHGGPIPFQYAYLEFLIMHEYLHYSEADFYYQQIIPSKDISQKSHQKIINYVGDFRSNYLLVKSGYEQIPIGLFCDKINYDRQNAYIDMYNIVKNEMQQLPQQGGGGEMELPIEVGTRVRCPNGKKGVVTAINPDGTAEVQEED